MSSSPGSLPPLPPRLFQSLRQVVRDAEERRTGLIPPPPAPPPDLPDGEAFRVAPDAFVETRDQDDESLVDRFNLGMNMGRAIGRQPSDSMERLQASMLEDRVNEFLTTWQAASQLDIRSTDGVFGRIEGLSALASALEHFQAIRGALPNAAAHGAALQEAVALVKPVQRQLTPLVLDVVAGRLDDTRMLTGDALALTRSTRRVPEVLMELAQRLRVANRTDPLALPRALHQEVRFEQGVAPEEGAEQLESLAATLACASSQDDIDDAIVALDELDVQLRDCALRPYLSALYLALDAVHRDLDEVDLGAADSGNRANPF